MNRLQEIIAYLCLNYPHKKELSKARLTKLVYLADWFSALADDEQLTDIDWIFNHYGPYVEDVADSAATSEYFTMTTAQTIYGSAKYLIGYNGPYRSGQFNLTPRDKQILDAVIEKTKFLYFNDFIDYVYSTYPVVSENRYSALNLVGLAQEYKASSA